MGCAAGTLVPYGIRPLNTTKTSTTQPVKSSTLPCREDVDTELARHGIILILVRELIKITFSALPCQATVEPLITSSSLRPGPASREYRQRYLQARNRHDELRTRPVVGVAANLVAPIVGDVKGLSQAVCLS